MENWSKKRKIDSDFHFITVKQIKLEDDNNMFCWGSTIHGELGLGNTGEERINLPQEVDFVKATEVEQIACGVNYTVLITRDGQIYSCGDNGSGQLGHEEGTRGRLELIPGLEAFMFKKIACGGYHNLVLNDWGQLFCWGCNSEGQLGLDSLITLERIPRMLRALGTSVVIQIACGFQHSLALTNNGELYAWGSNEEGQLGINSNTNKEFKPKLVTYFAGVPIAFIACGGYHSTAVTKSGAVFAWGRNTFGQLGLNDNKSRKIPHLLKTLRNSKVQFITCGEDFSVFLTLDGGVFTCGAGTNGQLGHGTFSNEILPRQVMELMGSQVTQISCGRKHTLAFVPTLGRIYAWGLGDAGQLGTYVAQVVSTPQVVLGPWLTHKDIFAKYVKYNAGLFSKDCAVKHIFSGGNHCFVTVTHGKDKIDPDDCRIREPSSQILIITEEQLRACHRVPAGASVDQELLTYLETVFRSIACINASFLLENSAHYGCSEKCHGVNVEQAAKLFFIISDLCNDTIKSLIFNCITESILPSLRQSLNDIESLRIFLSLPFYHAFSEPSNYHLLQAPLARIIMNLKSDHMKLLSNWWCEVKTLEKLLRIYKGVVKYFFKEFIIGSTQWNLNVKLALSLLELFHNINNNSKGKKLPSDTFHLSDLVNDDYLRMDYLKWFSENPHSTNSVYLCDYPFLLDAKAKMILLQADQAIQMQTAMNASNNMSLTQLMLMSFLDRQITDYLVFNVTRENIVDDTLRELRFCSSLDLKKPLKVKFHGEEAEDAGGVKKEFFLLVFKEILDPKYGMFKEYEETRTIWFSEFSFEDVQMYFMIGCLCGLVIYNFIIINLPFPLVLYKKLLNESVGLDDIKDMDPIQAKSLQDILDYEENDFEEVFCLNFEVTQNIFGENKSIELIPCGSSTPVTLENKKQYVDCMVDYILNKSVEEPFKKFHEGFHKVCGGRVLPWFESHELMSVVIGHENYDWDAFESNASYREGYTKDDPTIILFWKVFHELSLEEKKKFLLFLTGSDRIPIQGMSAISIAIQPLADERMLPVAHTCFNLLDLPRYKTRERLRYKLLQAIQQTQGFSIV